LTTLGLSGCLGIAEAGKISVTNYRLQALVPRFPDAANTSIVKGDDYVARKFPGNQGADYFNNTFHLCRYYGT